MSQDIKFIKEDITFRVKNNKIHIDGYYWFCNESSKEIHKRIYFPITDINEGISFDSIEVYKMPTEKAVNISYCTAHGFCFDLDFINKETLVYRIKYQQKIAGDSIKYILLSTRSWDLPLESAEYKLIMKKNDKVKRFSLKPDKEFILDKERIYYWKKTDFMPEIDLIFYF